MTQCPACGGAIGALFYATGPVPVHCCLMVKTEAEAVAFAKEPVDLAQCGSCGFVTNISFDAQWSFYAAHYEDQQGFSPTFMAFANQFVKDLIDRHELAGKSAVEIGCSKGDFLAMLCEAGGMSTVGIDPSATAARAPLPTRGTLRVIQEEYDDAHLDLPADLIVCRHTLEHIQDVQGMLSRMHQHAQKTQGARVLIEVPDAERIWRTGAFEDVYYEHCSYFTAGSLARALRKAGFGVTDLRKEFGDQYLVAEASADPNDDKRFAIETEVPTDLELANKFGAVAGAEVAHWRKWLSQQDDGPIAIWGSGSKAVAFYYALDAAQDVAAVVDINPHRHGLYAPGIPIEITAPQSLTAIAPKSIVIMNKIYVPEISADCETMGLSADILALGEV